MFRPPDNPPSTNLARDDPNEFSPGERQILLRLAHAAIQSAIDNREIPGVAPSAHLEEPRGAFTTIYYRGALRGCVGYVLPTASLYQTVIETARDAAFKDSRFWPVKREEIPELQVSLSILSTLEEIRTEDVQIGKHGLLISLAGRRGLLLPQVAVEHEWDRNQFLEHTCRKAGLPPGAWNNGATLQAFTAEIFGDSDPK